jgi:hypothetical protein
VSGFSTCGYCSHIDADHKDDGRCGRCECPGFQMPKAIERVDLAGQKYVASAPSPLKLTSDVRVPPSGSW